MSAVFSGQPSSQPAGTLIDGSDVFFDYTSQGGGDIGSNYSFGAKWDGTIIEKTTSPGSRYANVIRKNMFIGDTHGWNGLASDGDFVSNYESLYFRMIYRFSDNWQFNADGEKLWMFGEAGGSSSSFYPGPAGNDLLQFRNQSANTGGGGIWRSRSLTLPVGEWHTIELFIVAQSALGVADGSFQLWHNGVEVTDFQLLSGATAQNAVEWFDSGHTSRLFSGLHLPLYWGGQGPPKTVNDHLDISEFYITGKGAVG